mmetsp:Transcript_109530/g.317918  ORF Transcript_109530/g.317918 Transcript_109530/m.317918 type:complete len:218 (-) Transcript_109530:323-976(-)
MWRVRVAPVCLASPALHLGCGSWALREIRLGSAGRPRWAFDARWARRWTMDILLQGPPPLPLPGFTSKFGSKECGLTSGLLNSCFSVSGPAPWCAAFAASAHPSLPCATPCSTGCLLSWRPSPHALPPPPSPSGSRPAACGVKLPSSGRASAPIASLPPATKSPLPKTPSLPSWPPRPLPQGCQSRTPCPSETCRPASPSRCPCRCRCCTRSQRSRT